MDFEKMQSTMQFLLEQQAKHDVMMYELHENFKILTALAQNHDERMDSIDGRTDSLEEELKLQVESFRAHLQAQREDFYARLDADTQAFKDRLAESEAQRQTEWAKYQANRQVEWAEYQANRQAEWAEHDARHVALDARLDRLAAIVETEANNRQRPPSG